MFKKLLALFCVLALISSCVCVYAKNPESELSSEICHILNLGFMENDENGDFRADYIVTRGEFAGILAKVVNAAYAADNTSPFGDVEISDKYYNDIVFCYQNHILNGYGDGNFRPNEPITVMESVKAYVSLLGYDIVAHVNGGYPTGYDVVARRISLLSGIYCPNYNLNITREQMAVLTFNAFCSNMYEINELSDGGVKFDSTDTLAYRYHDLIYDEGIAEANEYYAIADCDTAGSNAIAIDGKQYNLTNLEDKYLVGKYTEFFYKKDSHKLVSAICSRDNRELVLYADDFYAFENDSVKYFSDKDTKTAKLSSDAKFFLNYDYVLDYDLNKILNMDDPEIILIDNNNDGRYDIVYVNNYKTLVVGSKSSDNKVTDRFNPAVMVDLEENSSKIIEISDEDNVKKECSDIERDNVLSILECRKFIKVNLCKNRIKGKLEGVDDNTFVIASAQYPILQALRGKYKDLAGSEVSAFLNARGYIVGIISENTEDVLYGYVRAGYFDNKKINKDCKLKIFTSKGENVIYCLSEKYTINGKHKNSADGLPDDLCSGGAVVGQLVHYSLDSNGNIKTIETAKQSLTSYENSFFVSFSSLSSRYNANSSSFEGKSYVDSNTILMQVPDDGNDEDCKIIQKSNIGNLDYNIVAYNNSLDNSFADVIVFKNKVLTLNFDSSLAVFMGVSSAINADGDDECKINYFAKGEQKSAFVRDDIKDAISRYKKGDVFRYASDDRYIVDVQLVYDTESGFKLSTSSDFGTSFRAVHGFVAKADSQIVRISPDQMICNDSSVYSLEGHVLNRAETTVVEFHNDKVNIRAGNIDDALVGDEVIITTRSGVAKYFVIIKRN